MTRISPWPFTLALLLAALTSGCATFSSPRPTTDLPQTFVIQTESDTWQLTHSTDSAFVVHSDSGAIRNLYGADDPSEYQEPGEYYGFAARLISVVGPHITYEVREGGYSSGAAHGFAAHHFVTVDLRLEERVLDGRRRRRGVPLDWLMHEGVDCARELLRQPADQQIRAFCEGPQPERIIEEALARDPWFSALREDDSMCTYDHDMIMGTSYGFERVEPGYVTVLLGLGHGCEVNRGAFHQVRLRLPTPSRLERDLAIAAERGTLAQDLRPENDWADGQ